MRGEETVALPWPLGDFDGEFATGESERRKRSDSRARRGKGIGSELGVGGVGSAEVESSKGGIPPC